MVYLVVVITAFIHRHYIYQVLPLTVIMEFAATSLEDLDSGYNVVMPAPANAIFTYSDERGTVGWLPHPGLTDSLRNDLTAAVGQSPRAWLFPPEDGELFDQPEHAFARLQGYSLAAGFCVVKGQGTTPVRKNYWCRFRDEKWPPTVSTCRDSREIRMTPRKLSVLGNVNSQANMPITVPGDGIVFLMSS